MSFVLFLGFFFGDLLLAQMISRTPEAFARFAVIPVRAPVTLPVPPGVAPLVFPLRDEGATYRAAPARGIALVSLPGEARVERENLELRFVSDAATVLARPRGRSTSLVRVQITGDANGLVLRAHRLPSEVPWEVFFAIAFVRLHGFHGHMSSIVFLTVASVLTLRITRERGRIAFDGVTREMRARLAIANGDPPPATEPVVPKLTGDEWACACGKVNKMKKTMCGRCWAQRPGSP